MRGCGGCGCAPAYQIVQGDGYHYADGRALCFDSRGCNHWPDGMSKATLYLDPVAGGCDPCAPQRSIQADGAVSRDGCGVLHACFDLPCAMTNRLPIGKHSVNYRVVACGPSDAPITIAQGWLDVR